MSRLWCVYISNQEDTDMKRSHSTRTYPANKMIPIGVVKDMTSVQRKVIKKQHTRRSRKYRYETEVERDNAKVWTCSLL